MKNLDGSVAAITGAGSGIGRATALLFAKNGVDVALSDIDQYSLDDTLILASNFGVHATKKVVDVANREEVYAWADSVVEDHGKVNIIVNNAGVGLGSRIEDMAYEDFEWLFNINFWGVVYGTKAFLPHIKNASEGHVVNISSVFGLIAVPTQAAYNCAKFAVKAFTECLREELEIEGSNVSCTSIHPGGIKTNIARNSRMGDVGDFIEDHESIAERFESIARTSPEQAAIVILNAVKANRRRALIGTDALVIDLAQRLMPTTYQKILEMGAKRFMAK